MAKKIKPKETKEVKSLLIALLLGDGTISNNYVFKLSHCKEQLEFLQWKLQLLDKLNIKHNGIKTYVSKTGYNVGSEVLYSQMSIRPIIKVLRRVLYIPKKTINRKILNWLTPQGIAIWYMDDGHININESKQRSSPQYSIKIATCTTLDVTKDIINYFKEIWNINMREFPEGKGTYSISSCCKEDAFNFIDIVKPYVQEIPSMLYKIRTSSTKKEFIAEQMLISKSETV